MNSAHHFKCGYKTLPSPRLKSTKLNDKNKFQDAQTKKEQDTASTSFRPRGLYIRGYNDPNHIYLGGQWKTGNIMNAELCFYYSRLLSLAGLYFHKMDLHGTSTWLSGW